MILYQIIIFILTFTSLYFLSQKVNQGIFQIIYRLTRSRTTAMSCLSLILFPGTVVHELAHYFSANMLGVPTGRINLIPEPAQKDTIRLGSVNLAQSDPIRHLLIGLAPEISGLICLSTISYFTPVVWQKIFPFDFVQIWSDIYLYIFLILIYLAFSIANCMFSSKSDLQGLWVFLIIASVLFFLCYQSGVTFQISGIAARIISQTFTYLTGVVSLVTIINILIYLLIQLILRFRK
jgi:hypothetical protein